MLAASRDMKCPDPWSDVVTWPTACDEWTLAEGFDRSQQDRLVDLCLPLAESLHGLVCDIGKVGLGRLADLDVPSV